MASLRLADVQDRPTEFLDFTSLTLNEFQQLVPDSPGLSGKFNPIDMVEVIGALIERQSTSEGGVVSGNQGAADSSHPRPLGLPLNPWNVAFASLWTLSMGDGGAEDKSKCGR